MYLITSLLILLATSRILGRFFESIGFFAITGEIMAGFLLGPAIFNFIDPQIDGLNGIVELGVFLLIFAAGLEIDLKDFIISLKNKALICGIIAFILSFGSGCFFGFLFDFNLFTCIVIGLCFAITAIPVTIKFLRNVQLINRLEGHTVMGAAIVIEILALLVLGISSGADNDYSFLQYLKLVVVKGASMLLFFFFVLTVNKAFHWEFTHAKKARSFLKGIGQALGDDAAFGIGVLFVLLFSTISESLGFHFIIGAFFGGLLLNKDVIGTNFFDSLSLTVRSITRHFLTPIFFAYLGLQINLSAFEDAFFVFSFLFVGYGVKILSSWAGAKVAGFSNEMSFKMGLILNSRGTFDLIVAELALEKAYIDSKIFSILILFGVSSVLFNPVIYRQIYSRGKNKAPPED